MTDEGSYIIRQIDALGRIVIPIEMRRALQWDMYSAIKIRPFGRYVFLEADGEPSGGEAVIHESHPILCELLEKIRKMPEENILLMLELAKRLQAIGPGKENAQND